MNGEDFVRRQSSLLKPIIDVKIMIIIDMTVVVMTPTMTVMMRMMNRIILPTPKCNVKKKTLLEHESVQYK
jgi:hypothetical protein